MPSLACVRGVFSGHVLKLTPLASGLHSLQSSKDLDSEPFIKVRHELFNTPLGFSLSIGDLLKPGSNQVYELKFGTF